MNSMECLHVFYLKIECFYSIYVVHGYHIIMMLAQISRKNIQTLFIFYHHFCARSYFRIIFIRFMWTVNSCIVFSLPKFSPAFFTLDADRYELLALRVKKCWGRVCLRKYVNIVPRACSLLTLNQTFLPSKVRFSIVMREALGTRLCLRNIKTFSLATQVVWLKGYKTKMVPRSSGTREVRKLA